MLRQISFVISFLLVEVLFLHACRSSDVLPPGPAFIGLKKSVTFRSGLTVSVDSLNDFRCPKNVQCIWQGNASARLQLTQNQSTQSVKLYVWDMPHFNYAQTADVVLNGRSYRIILREVSPYPDYSSLVNTSSMAVVEVIDR